jgi:CheY-like chemotaxis protein
MVGIQAQSLLVVEDSDEDFEAFGRIITSLSFASPIYRCTDGDDALDFLYKTGKYADAISAPRPRIILLDLNLPGVDGREILNQIKQDNALKTIPVVVFTTSSNPKDIESCYQQGVNGYIIKPINANKLVRSIQIFIDYWFEVSALPPPMTR